VDVTNIPEKCDHSPIIGQNWIPVSKFHGRKLIKNDKNDTKMKNIEAT